MVLFTFYASTTAIFWGFFLLKWMEGPNGQAKDPNYITNSPRGWGWTLITFMLEHPASTIFLAWLVPVLVIAGHLVEWNTVQIFYTLFFPVYVLVTAVAQLIAQSWLQESCDNARDMEASNRLLIFKDKQFEKYWGTSRIPIDEACQALLDQKLDFVNYKEVFMNRYGLFKFVISLRHIQWFLTNILGKAVGHDHSSDLADITGVYNRGNDFYHLFMGDTMLYSSGIYNHPDEPLEVGQLRKLDSIANICQIKEGTKHLDLGCGWGTLLAYFASRGTKSLGITLSGEQAKFCEERVKANLCEENAEIKVINFWDLPNDTKYDVITCLEMSEHIGIAHYSKFLKAVNDMLEDGGLFYLQIAGLRRNWQFEDLVWGLFMGKYIFPGADASCPLGWVIQQSERAGFEVRRTHNLGCHYGLTIEKWLDNWVENREEVVQKYGEWWYRLWGIFLGWSCHIAYQGSSTVWFISLRKNLRSDRSSVTNAPEIPEPVIDRLATDCGANKLGTESGNDFAEETAPWSAEGSTMFDVVKTHIDLKNLRVRDDVGEDKEVPYSLKEKVLYTLIMCMTGLGFAFVYLLAVTSAGENLRKLSRFTLSTVVMLTLCSTRWCWVWLSRPLTHKFAKGFDNTQTVHQMAAHGFKAMYHIAMVIVGYLLLKDQPYFPTYLGGSGQLSGSGGISERLTEYCAVQIGFYLHCLVYLYCEKRKNDTLELVLASIVTIFLAAIAMMDGFERAACVLFFLHDLGDALGYTLKVLVETNMQVPTLVMYFALMPVWIYTRIYLLLFKIFPTLALLHSQRESGGENSYLYAPLLLLFTSHLYWSASLLYLGAMALSGERDFKKMSTQVPPVRLSCETKDT